MYVDLPWLQIGEQHVSAAMLAESLASKENTGQE